MKNRLIMMCVGLLLGMTSAAQAKGYCTNATIHGTYAFTVHGYILAGPPVMAAGGPVLVDGIAKTTFDGWGSLSQVDAVSQNGNLPEASVWRSGTGSYHINFDCTGTMTIANPGMPPLQLAIVVGRGGKTIHTVVLNPGFAITSDAEWLELAGPR